MSNGYDHLGLGYGPIGHYGYSPDDDNGVTWMAQAQMLFRAVRAWGRWRAFVRRQLRARAVEAGLIAHRLLRRLATVRPIIARYV
jgi:hypothetical protein